MTHDCFIFVKWSPEPHVTHLFYIVVVLFLFFCAIRSPLSFHSSVDYIEGKGDYSNVALSSIRIICLPPLNTFVKFY